MDDTVTVSWAGQSRALSYEVELRGMFWDATHPNPPRGTSDSFTVAASQTRSVTKAGRGDFTYSARLRVLVGGGWSGYSAWSASAACAVEGSPVWVTRGAYDGIMQSARQALTVNGCQSLSQKKLAAVMIAIGVEEVSGGTKNKASSPMALSVNETSGLSKFYYLKGASGVGHRAAYWYPGVGLWQLDWMGPTRSKR